MLIIIDSLDEAVTQKGETILDVLEKQAPDLPAWLRVITTTRPEPPVLRRLKTLNVFELRTDCHDNTKDVRDYINLRLAAPLMVDRVGKDYTAIARRLEGLATGNFLYAKLALDDLKDGLLKAEDLGKLTNKLDDFYTQAFIRRFGDID